MLEKTPMNNSTPVRFRFLVFGDRCGSRMHCGHWRLLIMVTLLISASLVVAQVTTRSRYLYVSDQGMKLLQVVNITSPEPSIDLKYPGEELVDNPKFSPFVGHAVYRGGQWYSVFPLPYAFLDAPFYRLLGIQGLYVIPGLSLIAIGILTYLLASTCLDRIYAFLTALLAALGTPLFFYGLVNWEHELATALVTAAVLFLWSGLRHSQAIRIVLSGTLVGLACWIRPESYVFLAAAAFSLVVFAGFDRISYILRYLAGIAFAVFPLLVFNAFVYGNPLGLQVASNFGHGLQAFISLGSFFPITSRRWLTAYALIVGAVVLSRMVSVPRRPAYALAGMEISALIAVLITILYLRNRWGISNFIEASPSMVLVPWVLVRLSKDHWTSRLRIVRMFFLCAVFTILVVLSSPVTGGSQWGGRFFLLVAPLWAILGVTAYRQLVAYVKEHMPDSVHRFLLPTTFYTILISSILTQTASIEFLSTTKRSWEPLGQLVSDLPRDTVLITNSWWIPLVLAPDFYDHYIFYVSSKDDLCQLSHTLLQNKGISSLSVISTPELLDTPTGACSDWSISLKELFRESLSLWTSVVIENYTIVPADSQIE